MNGRASYRPRDDHWESLAREGRLADAIEAYVKQYDWVTFAELLHRMDGFADVRGTIALEIAPNVVLYAGLSDAFADAVRQLQSEKRIWPYPTSMLTYFIDGGGLTIPLAKRIPKGGYKQQRWLPVCFRVIEPKEGGRR